MAEERAGDANIDPFKQASPHSSQIRSSSARVPEGVNAHAVANAQIIGQKKSEIRHSIGRTLSTSAKKLLADARRKEPGHSGILSDNTIDAGRARSADVAAHHVVAWQHRDAFASRSLLSGWGIGINDVDNGVYLPRFEKTLVPSLPKARKHSPPRTWIHHTQVFGRSMKAPCRSCRPRAARNALDLRPSLPARLSSRIP